MLRYFCKGPQKVLFSIWRNNLSLLRHNGRLGHSFAYPEAVNIETLAIDQYAYEPKKGYALPIGRNRNPGQPDEGPELVISENIPEHIRNTYVYIYIYIYTYTYTIDMKSQLKKTQIIYPLKAASRPTLGVLDSSFQAAI